MTNWQRLEQVILWTGLSTNAFAKAIGLKRSENLYQIKRGSFGISKELARLIVTKYPVVSRPWLLTGEGSIFHNFDDSTDVTKNASIPFYDVDVMRLLSGETLEKTKPLYKMAIPALSDVDFAAMCTGQSMSPEIPSGSTVFFKQIQPDSILLGESYLIIAPDFSVIRYVRSVEGDHDKLLLVPNNTKDYDDMVIERSKIEKLFMVKGILNYK